MSEKPPIKRKERENEENIARGNKITVIYKNGKTKLVWAVATGEKKSLSEIDAGDVVISDVAGASSIIPTSNNTICEEPTRIPTDIRVKIWKLTIPESLIVQIWEGPSSSESSDLLARSIYTHQTPPLALQICQESRKEALKKYTVQLDTHDYKFPILIDPKNDILYFADTKENMQHDSIQGELMSGRLFPHEVRKDVERLAIHLTQWCPYGFGEEVSDTNCYSSFNLHQWSSLLSWVLRAKDPAACE